jgi:hypothetical protein
METKSKKETFLHIRCENKDKSNWVRCAYPGTLSQWIVKVLNNEVKQQKGE